MRSRQPAWAEDSFLAVHNWWHWALFFLDQDELGQALQIYDGRIRQARSEDVLDVIDAAALLWRFLLRGVGVGSRWAELADAYGPRAEEAFYAFNDAHAMMALVGAERWDVADNLLAAQETRLESGGSNQMMTREVGLPVCRALYAFGREDYAATVQLLRPIRFTANRFGGSHAQRDVLDLTLYHFDLFDALGLDSPNVMGHFFGAMIAAEMAAIRPERVGRLVLASPAGLWLDDDPGVDYFATPADELRGLLFNDPESVIAMEAMPDPDSDEDRARMGIERARALSTVARFLWPIPDKGLSKRLHRIRSETLVIVADGDRIVPPSHGAELAARVPSSSLHIVEDAGHLLILERPDEIARLVSGFLESR